MTSPVYPVGLMLAGRKCLVVGGGRVAARKIRGLVLSGASVTVVAPQAHEAIGLLAAQGVIEQIDASPIDLQLREYRPGEAAAYNLVLTATGIPEVDGMVHHDAVNAGVWVNSADDIDNCTFILPAVLRDGPVTVAVSTSGSSPALATWLKRHLFESMGRGMGELAGLLAEARELVKSRGKRTESVDWEGLLEGPLPGLVAEGRMEEARRLIEAQLEGGA
jgi:siroheme synthase-like protein